MKDILEETSSLIFALFILLGILFLPDSSLKPITSILKFLAKGQNTSYAFGNYLIQKILSGLLIFIITIFLYRALQKSKSD